ncbi:glutamyl-tRNA reductase [Methanobrevibacter filiformis]|uniref:glutamyl-tRNA reductase n=1 Tax=Methanobrevibacter filiformis TaxID=55758 RepID=UPI0008313859|nr:glutamyl-tRNA reductase [Methanobrevibacter filiformis]
MIINIRVDHTIADIETMENVSTDLKKLFNEFREEFSIQDYVEIATCNRSEYYIHTDQCDYDHDLLDHENKSLIIECGDSAIIHLLRTSSGLESMIIGEDQILGQIKDSKAKSVKEGHCGKVLDTLFTKAIHVGQSIRGKTKINRGSVSIGSAAVDLAQQYFKDLENKHVLVIGAGKMGTLVAKALASKDLKAIFVANRTYYRAKRLADELNGKAILLDDLKNYLPEADLIISATGSPHTIINKERIGNVIPKERRANIIMIDLANPRDIDEEVKEIGINLFNIDDLRGIAEENKEKRQKEVEAATKIIDEEFELLKKSFKTMEFEGLISDIRLSMEDIRKNETRKALYKLNKNNDNINQEKIIENLSRSIVNKIFHDISKNIKNAATEEDHNKLNMIKSIFLNNK